MKLQMKKILFHIFDSFLPSKGTETKFYRLRLYHAIVNNHEIFLQRFRTLSERLLKYQDLRSFETVKEISTGISQATLAKLDFVRTSIFISPFHFSLSFPVGAAVNG